MGKKSIVDYVRSLDSEGHRRLRERIEAHRRFSRRYTWDGFFEMHFDRSTLWGWSNTLFAWLGTVAGLVYGVVSSVDDWRGIIWLLLETGLTTLIGWIAGVFATAVIVVGAVAAVIVGIIWLIVYLISLF